MSKQQQPRIVTILGSTREGRFGETVGAWFREIADSREDFVHEYIDLRDVDLPFLGHQDDDAEAVIADWKQTIDNADGVVMITPEYNHSTSAVLKNAIDHAYAEWNNKPLAIVSYGGGAGGSRSAEHLRLIGVELQMAPIREGIHIVMARNNFDEDGKPKDPMMDGRAESMLNQLMWWTNALKAARENTSQDN